MPTRTTTPWDQLPSVPAAKMTKSEEDEICLYPSKKCTNKRAHKKNGELHTMCEYHRIRANENQRRLERRRKAARKLPDRQFARPTLWNRVFPEPIPIQTRAEITLKLELDEALWHPLELEILQACLFDETESPRKSCDNTIDLSQLRFPEVV
ncbi:hypothetical protein Poli38472_006131 [Pythium oligandrum]|uniref:Uncharacterized protein n=1 Tax=Pythium oligandrum TaxID=41045 RepID=A0A8K1CUU1_PYTOL|nr:hypothetical protein Poli38472_006131 [Pythium oligandrum]|eukprot:TMW68663.1 hypothetical protein Poli38472_006131 [Pythium oligandrum]